MPSDRKTSENTKTDVLVLYRLQMVEEAVKAVGDKLEKQENIKKVDLIEFRDSILQRFNDVREGLQGQVDELKTEKADQKQVDDLRTLVKAIGSVLGSIIVALVVYYFTTGRNQ